MNQHIQFMQKEKFKNFVKKIPASFALLTAELIFVFSVFIISLTSLIIIIRTIFYNKEDMVDQKVFDFIVPFITNTNTEIILFFSFLGSYYFMVPAWLLIFSYYLFIRKKLWEFIKTLTIAVSNLAMLLGLKHFFNRPRPLVPLLKEIPGLSFPSGHAFMGFIFYGLLIYISYREISNKWLKLITIIILIFLIILVGFSRVYLRVHYASDVIAGYCFGFLSLTILIVLLKKIEEFNAKKTAPHLTQFTF